MFDGSSLTVIRTEYRTIASRLHMNHDAISKRNLAEKDPEFHC